MLDRYFELGWPVLPLLPGDIRPPFPWREFQEKPPGKREWALWREIFSVPPHGVALLTGRPSGIVVVDIDDPKVAERLQVEIPFLTPCVRTRRGFHFYFVSGDVPTMKVEIPDIGRIEIKGDGSLVPLPPTRHRKDPSKAYEWIISPWEAEIPPLPDFIFEALERQARERELALAVGRVSFPRPGRKLAPEVLREILDQARVEVVKEIFLGDRTAWRLRTCPLCGKSEGNPWVISDTGRLFDFRATCPASRDNGGLPLRAWLREIGKEHLLTTLEIKENEEALPSQVPAATVDEARGLILQALRGGGDLIVTVPPGVGKSRTTLEWFCREGPRPAVYSVPTLSLARELAEEAGKLTADPVLVFEGRNARTCLRWEEARTAHELGYDPGEVLCPTCPHNPKTAVFSNKCEFMRQFEGVNRTKGLFFASHKLACHLIKDFLTKARVWVLDEEPYNLIEVVSCPLDGLRTLRAVFPEDSATMRLTESILKLGDELHRATNGRRSFGYQGRIYARPVEFGPWAGKKTLGDFLNLDLTALAPKIREEIERILKIHRKSKLFKEGVNFYALRWIEEVVGQGQAYLVARKDPERPLELRQVINPVPDKWRGRLVVLDATAHPPVVERALKRPGMQVLDVRVPVEVKTAWLKRSVSKTSISQEKGRKTAIKAIKEALKIVKAERVLVFCHQAIKAQVEEAVAQDGREIVVTHHFGSESRGTNLFAGFGAAVLLGLPVPSPGAFYDVALALGLSTEKWETWLDLLARAEAWQEIHRIRPILEPGKEVVVIAPRWPFEEQLGPPEEEIEPEEIRGALALSCKVLRAWIAIFRFVWKEIALLLGIGRPEEIPPVEIRAEVWRRVARAYPEQVRTFLEQVKISFKGPGTPFDLPRPSCNFPDSRESKGVPQPFKDIIKGPGTPFVWEASGTPGASHPPLREIHFEGKGWWRKLLARLRKERPDLSVFEVSIRTPGGLQRTRGLGDLEAAKAFCQAVGLETNDDAWRYVNA